MTINASDKESSKDDSDVNITSKETLKFWDSEDKIFLIKVFTAGFVSILLSKLLSYVLPKISSPELVTTIISLFFKEAGVALMIAAALGYTVESMTRKKQNEDFKVFQQEVSKDVLSAVFKKIIPDLIFKEVKRSVLDQALIKRDASMSYELSEITDELAAQLGLSDSEKNKILVCDVTTTHILYNLSDLEIKNHPIRCGVSCDLDPRLQEALEIHEATIGDNELSHDEMKKLISYGKGRGVKEFETTVNLPSTKDGKGFKVSFCSRTFKKYDDTEVWTTLTPTEYMELEIGFPLGIEVGAKSNHPEDLESDRQNPNVRRKKYKLNHGVFPYQGITFWWHKSKPEKPKQPFASADDRE